jgi:hypothetical protein
MLREALQKMKMKSKSRGMSWRARTAGTVKGVMMSMVKRASTVRREKSEMIETFSQGVVLKFHKVLGGGGPQMNPRLPAATKLQQLSPNWHPPIVCHLFTILLVGCEISPVMCRPHAWRMSL